MPTRMRDRWRDRAEPAIGYGTVYWHVLMRDHPEAVAAVEEVQERLAPFSGFHLPPREWLHMTVCVAGSTTDISRDQMAGMLAHAQASLRAQPPVEASISRILYHPEAIMLAVEPRIDLLPIYDAAALATRKAVDGEVDELRSTWNPHITVSYSVDDQNAGPISVALGRSVEPRKVIINAMSLVIQWGPERAWDWEHVGVICLRRESITNPGA